MFYDDFGVFSQCFGVFLDSFTLFIGCFRGIFGVKTSLTWGLSNPPGGPLNNNTLYF